MYYQLYLDSLLLEEWIINFYVLELCRLCLMSTATHKRLMLAALFTGGFQVIMLCIPLPKSRIVFYIVLFVLYTLESYFTVIIAFGKAVFRIILKRTGVYMSVLMMTGGIFMGIFPRISLYKDSEAKILWFIIAGALVYVLMWQLFRNRRQSTYFGKLRLMHQGKMIEGKYFMDSGNGLKESISGKSVLLADAKWLFSVFDKESMMCRPVVYQSVGKQKGILYAYCFGQLVIFGERKSYTYENVWIGVCEERLFDNKDYQVILPLDYGIYYE